MAKRRRDEIGNGEVESDSEFNVVFVDTSLDTRLAMTVSVSDTVSHFKKRMELYHMNCFPEIGKIHINSLKVKRGGNFYHLPDFMLIRSVLFGQSETWFLSADASKTSACLLSQIPCNESKTDYAKTDAKIAIHSGEDLPSDTRRNSELSSVPSDDFEKSIVACPTAGADVDPAEIRKNKERYLKQSPSDVTTKKDLVASEVTRIEVEKYSSDCPSIISSEQNSSQRESRHRKKRKLCQDTVLGKIDYLFQESVNDPSEPNIVHGQDSMIDFAKEALGGQCSSGHQLKSSVDKDTTDDSGDRRYQNDIEKCEGVLSPSIDKDSMLGSKSHSIEIGEQDFGLEGSLCPKEYSLVERFDGKKSTKKKSKTRDVNSAMEILDATSGDNIEKVESMKLSDETRNSREEKDILSTKHYSESTLVSNSRLLEHAAVDLVQKETDLLSPSFDVTALMKPEISVGIKKKSKKKDKKCADSNMDVSMMKHADKKSAEKEDGVLCLEGIESQVKKFSNVNVSKEGQDANGDAAGSLPLSQNLEAGKDAATRKRKKKSKSTVVGLGDVLPVNDDPKVDNKWLSNAESIIQEETNSAAVKKAHDSNGDGTDSMPFCQNPQAAIDDPSRKGSTASEREDQVTEFNELKANMEFQGERPGKRKRKSKSAVAAQEDVLPDNEPKVDNKVSRNPEKMTREETDSAKHAMQEAQKANGDGADSVQSEKLQADDDEPCRKGSTGEIIEENPEIPVFNSEDQVREFNELKVNFESRDEKKLRKRKKKSKSTVAALEDKLQDKDPEVDNKAVSKKEYMIQEVSDAIENQRIPGKASNLETDKSYGAGVNFSEYFVHGKHSRDDEIITEACGSNEGMRSLKTDDLTRLPSPKLLADLSSQSNGIRNASRVRKGIDKEHGDSFRRISGVSQLGSKDSSQGGTSETKRDPKAPSHSKIPAVSSSRVESPSIDNSSACNSPMPLQMIGNEGFRSSPRLVKRAAATRRSQKKSLLTKPGSIFEDNSDESCADEKGKVHSDDSTMGPSSSSDESVHTDGESDLSLDSPKNRSIESGQRSNGDEEGLPTKKLESVDMILRSSKMFRRAVSRASSITEVEPHDSQPQEIVPESQLS